MASEYWLPMEVMDMLFLFRNENLEYQISTEALDLIHCIMLHIFMATTMAKKYI